MPSEVEEVVRSVKAHEGWTMNNVEKTLVIIIVLLCLSLAAIVAMGQRYIEDRFEDQTEAVDARFEDVDDRFDQGRQRTFQTQALLCQNLLSLGQTDQTGICDSEDVLNYYNPDEIGLTPSGEITCDIVRQMVTADPERFTLPEGCGG